MSRSVKTLLCAGLCLVLAGCSGLAATTDGDGTDRSDARTVKAARATPRPTATPEPTPEPIQVSDLVGEDGRFTVLLLGSDHRKGIAGERTDAIIVATMDPILGKVTMVSLPRDTVNVPIAPGQAYSDKINTLYFDLLGSGGKRKVALGKLRERLSYAFDTEIDRAALVDFDGLTRLIDSIGGVDVRLKEALVDPSMHIGEKGLRLKAGRQHLDGKEALAYSRSRHTTTDYDRARRQQQVISAAAAKVRRARHRRAAGPHRARTQEDDHGHPHRGRARIPGAGRLRGPRSRQLGGPGAAPLGAHHPRDVRHQPAGRRDPEALRPALRLGRLSPARRGSLPSRRTCRRS